MSLDPLTDGRPLGPVRVTQFGPKSRGGGRGDGSRLSPVTRMVDPPADPGLTDVVPRPGRSELYCRVELSETVCVFVYNHSRLRTGDVSGVESGRSPPSPSRDRNVDREYPTRSRGTPT